MKRDPGMQAFEADDRDDGRQALLRVLPSARPETNG